MPALAVEPAFLPVPFFLLAAAAPFLEFLALLAAAFLVLRFFLACFLAWTFFEPEVFLPAPDDPFLEEALEDLLPPFLAAAEDPYLAAAPLLATAPLFLFFMAFLASFLPCPDLPPFLVAAAPLAAFFFLLMVAPFLLTLATPVLPCSSAFSSLCL